MRKKLVNFIDVCGWLVARNSLENTLFHQRPTTLLIATFHGAFSMRPPTFPIWCASACRTHCHAPSIPPAYTDFRFPLPFAFFPSGIVIRNYALKMAKQTFVQFIEKGVDIDFQIIHRDDKFNIFFPVTNKIVSCCLIIQTVIKCFDKYMRRIERFSSRLG